jgi:mRNA interferase RelE/StbE
MNTGKAPSNLKKLEGKWAGYYRLRKRKIRIIFYVDKTERALYVDGIDFRGNVYK